MKAYKIISDSSCDINPSYLESLGVDRIPFYVSFDKETYRREISEISLEEFYKELTASKIFPKTSLPTVDDYMACFKKHIEAGLDVLCICITAKFSGSYQSAVTAREMTLEAYPDANIAVVNSWSATGGQGMLVNEAVRMRDAGLSLEENVANLEKLRETSNIMFTISTLEYLQRGGRIGKVTALAGSLLNLQPLIQLQDGELIPYGTVRGRKKALVKAFDMFVEFFNKNGLKYEDYNFGIICGYLAAEETEAQKARVEAEIGHSIDLPAFNVGVTIGTYTGPDPVGITFIRKYETL
ncbi:MAG: DegV family protein [Lachnospiraceae bacterium]|nr:DegV family protein [Lachnospiraceae bacterium]